MTTFDQKGQTVSKQINFSLEINQKFGITEIELAESLGVAKSALKNFLNLLNEENIPIEQWDSRLRIIAEQYKKLKGRLENFEGLESEESKGEIERAKTAISETRFLDAEMHIDKALEIENETQKILEASLKKKRTAICRVAMMKASSMRLRLALKESLDAFEAAMTVAKEVGDTGLACECLYEIGGILNQMGAFGAALKTFVDLLEIDSKRYEPSSPQIAAIHNNLGICNEGLGNYQSAISHFTLAVDSYLSTLGPQHPFVATCYNNIGMLHMSRAKFEEAIKYFELASKIREHHYPITSPPVVLIKANIGSALQGLGNLKGALPYLEQAFITLHNSLGSSDPRTSAARNYIGTLYIETGELEKATPHLEEALKVETDIYGESHPNVLVRYNNLAQLWIERKDAEKAIFFATKSVSTARSIMSRGHRFICGSLATLADAFSLRGDFEKAISLYDEAIQESEFSEIADSADMAKVRNQRGMTLLKMSRFEESLSELNRARALIERHLGTKSPAFVTVSENAKLAAYGVALRRKFGDKANISITIE